MRRLQERLIRFILMLTVLLPALAAVGILILLLWKGASGISWTFLTQAPSHGMRAGGIMPAIVGTVYLMALTCLFSVPLGVGGAIYLAEYAPKSRITRLIRVATVNLAGIPSIVYGLFGMGLFVLALKFGASLLAGALTLSVMTLPVVITAAEEALRSVPGTFREASLALGASRWQTVRHIVLPNALPGIMTGAAIGLARAAGETAPVLFTVAAFYLPSLPTSVFDKAMVLPYHLFVMATQVPKAPPQMQWGTALVLVGLVVTMQLALGILRSRQRRRRKW